MAQYTVYKCDKCKKEWLSTDKTEQPVSLGIDIEFGNATGKPISNRAMKNSQTAMWCRTCVMSIGIGEPCTDKDRSVAPAKELSFEEKFCLLVEELGFVRE